MTAVDRGADYRTRIEKACSNTLSNDSKTLLLILNMSHSKDRIAAIAHLFESVPVTRELISATKLIAGLGPQRVNLVRWCRFMEQHYVPMLESGYSRTPQKAIDSVSGLYMMYSYFKDRVFTIAQERHVMLCTLALLKSGADAHINRNSGSEMDTFIALADYRWMDIFMERADATEAICAALNSGKDSRVAELEAVLDDPDLSVALLDGAL